MSSKNKKKKNIKAVGPARQEPLETLNSVTSKAMPDRKRIWLFRLIAVIIVPLLFFALLETGLRIGGYGYPVEFFIKTDRPEIYRTNDKFGWRFFPRNLARSPLSRILPAKSDGTIRIFILGESAAQGVPDPTFGFGPILGVLLKARYPAVNFEIVNTAMTAINSHGIREIARDCAAHHPDLFVVYMGNNEVVGPFGPGTIFQRWNSNLAFIRTNLFMRSLRIGQVLDDAIRSFYSKKSSAEWRGMEMFLGNPVTVDDPRLTVVYENFRRNLRDICSVGRSSGAAVILSTVAVNLKDCPPFASRHRNGISSDELGKWTSLYHSGIELENNKHWSEALAKYEMAARIDNRFAELHFRIGRCLEAEGRFREAKDKFLEARDLDVLRFRADSKINEAIREVSATQEKNGIYWVDSEQLLAANSSVAGGIPGEELFFEHVHFTFDGNYLLARTLLDRVETALPQLAALRKTDIALSKQQCADALIMTPWDEHNSTALMEEMMSRPPFLSQLDHANQLATIQKHVNSLGMLSSTPEAIQDARRRYEAALRKMPDDWSLNLRFAKLLLYIDDPKSAVHCLNAALKQNPWEADLYAYLGVAERKIGNNERAIVNYQKALDLNPYSKLIHYNLGTILAEQGHLDEAITHFDKMLEFDPSSDTAYISLGGLQSRQGNYDEAAAHFKKALEINPTSVLVNHSLGLVLAKAGRTGEAITYLQKAVELAPTNGDAQFNLGEALYSSGRTMEAITHFQKAAEISPGNAVAYYWIAKILAASGRTEEAIENFRRALKVNPDLVEAQNELQTLLAR